MDKTHRCEKSKAAEMSIQYFKPWPFANYNWWLCSLTKDYEYNQWYLKDLCVIEYCPFCGEKLS